MSIKMKMKGGMQKTKIQKAKLELKGKKRVFFLIFKRSFNMTIEYDEKKTSIFELKNQISN